MAEESYLKAELLSESYQSFQDDFSFFFVYRGTIPALPEGIYIDYSGAKYVALVRRWQRGTSPCTAFTNTCKAPLQTVETPALAGTKTPLTQKFLSKGATTDHLENLRKLPALRAVVIGRSVGQDASPLSCFE